MRRLAAVLCSFMTVALLLTGCGSSSGSSYQSAAREDYAVSGAYYEDYDVAEEAAEEPMSASYMGNTASVTTEEESAAGETSSALPRKLVTRVSISTETEDLDEFEADIKARIEAAGGYIENSSRSGGSANNTYTGGRYAYYTVRIPSDRVESFVEGVKENSNVLNSSTSVEDITLSYYDTDSWRKAYRIEQEQLLEMLEQAETIEDMITIREQLTEINYHLQNYESQIRLYDNQVNYATVSIDVDEVRVYTPVTERTAFERMGEGFVESVLDIVDGIKEFFISFVINLPYLLVWGVVILIIVLVVRAIMKSSKKRSQKKAEKIQAARMAKAQAQAQAQAQARPVQPTAPGKTAGDGQKE